MKTTATVAEIVTALFPGADEVDYVANGTMAIIRQGVTQVMVEGDGEGMFAFLAHTHEDGDEAGAITCHAWKVGMMTNPIGAMLSEMFGQAFDQDGADAVTTLPASGDSFWL